MLLPPSRSGKGPELRLEDREGPITGDELLDFVPGWELDDITARLWEGKRRMASYEMPHRRIDRKVTAVVLQDFAEAADRGRAAEVGSQTGMKALAVAYGLLESGQAGRVVSLDDVLSGKVRAYQSDIDAALGLE